MTIYALSSGPGISGVAVIRISGPETKMVIEKMKDIISGTEKMFGAEIELDYQKGYPPTVNDESTYEKLISSARKIVGENAKEPYLSMGAEDFSYFANEIPGCFFFVGSAPLEREPLSVPHHCSHFDIDERALLVGSSIFVQVIEDLIGSQSN